MALPARNAKQITSSRIVPLAVTVLAGTVVGHLVEPFLFDALNVIAWRRPVQNWLITIGLGRYAPYYAFLSLHWPDVFLAIPAGLVIGFIGYRRWVRWLLLYISAYVLIPWAVYLTYRIPTTGVYFHWLGPALTTLAVAPPALLAAWIGSRGKRRRDARRRAGACLKCGYDLQGNVSGRCPECGAAVARLGARQC
jgi:hypothetical protein